MTGCRLLVAGVVLLGTNYFTWAAEPPVRTRLVVTVGSTVELRMTSGKRIASVENEKEQVARVLPSPKDQTCVLVTGIAPGITRITLTDVDGRKEVHQFGQPAGPALADR